jgi:23S rRNA G2445 N2-methylase RlmL
MDKVIEHPKLILKGSDIDEKSITTCRYNAESAGVSDLIEFEVKDLSDYLGQLKYHQIVTNPPYGVRIKGVHVIGKLTKLASRNKVYFIHPTKHRTGEVLFTTNNGALTVHFQKIK